MIKTPITFIIGAGASVPYGLPTGKQLKNKARDLNPNSDLYQLVLQDRSISPGQLNTCLGQLREHPADSIDGFLDTQTDQQTNLIGKRVIAVLMGEAMRHIKRAADNADWLGYIMKTMLDEAYTIKDFQENHVTFVTFNFDTIIETRFRKEIASAYQSGTANFPPVVHVHGMLSTPPLSEPREAIHGFSSDWVEWVGKSATNINVVLDAIDDRTLEAARRAVSEATVLCFLGFAFANRNQKRLGLPDILAGSKSPEFCFGSALGLESGERNRFQPKFYGKLQLGDEEQDCLTILRKLNVFRD